MTINQVADVVGMKGQTIREQRSNNMLPKISFIYKMASFFSVPIEYLLTGKNEYMHPDPRIQGIIRVLEENPDMLDAIETLLFEKNAGQSSKYS